MGKGLGSKAEGNGILRALGDCFTHGGQHVRGKRLEFRKQSARL